MGTGQLGSRRGRYLLNSVVATGELIARGAITLLGVSVIIFLAAHLTPGSFESLYLPIQASPEDRARVLHSLGLDLPLPVQYVVWLRAILRGDFGMSLISHRTVAEDLALRAPATIELAALALVISLVVGIPIGMAAGIGGNGRIMRTVSRLLGSVGVSMPDFLLASVLLLLASRFATGLTSGEYVPLWVDPLQNLRVMILPSLALATLSTTLLARTARDAVLNVLTSPHITSAIARGERRSSIFRRHILRNASVPLVTVVAVNVAGLLSGTLVIEKIFSIPGLGQYAVNAVQFRDYAVVMATVLFAATAFVFCNTAADLLYVAIDPRMRRQRKAK